MLLEFTTKVLQRLTRSMTKSLFKEHEFATKGEAMQFIRQLELANDKRANEYFLREVEE